MGKAAVPDSESARPLRLLLLRTTFPYGNRRIVIAISIFASAIARGSERGAKLVYFADIAVLISPSSALRRPWLGGELKTMFHHLFFRSYNSIARSPTLNSGVYPLLLYIKKKGAFPHCTFVKFRSYVHNCLLTGGYLPIWGAVNPNVGNPTL